ncbi:MAG: hypothetical protein IPL21_01820 [Saprospirales bacterium]|nr:hypothetical protein [Saprospirales bacterium]
MGLVNKLVEPADLLTTANAIATSICSRGGHAVREAKRVMWEGLEETQDEGMKLEQKAFGHIFNDKETAEGLSAFLEKKTQFLICRNTQCRNFNYTALSA